MAKEPTLLFGVGATKAGTSWFFDYIAAHQQCHIRTIKELHYFDTVERGAFRQQLRRRTMTVDGLEKRLVKGSEREADKLPAKLQDAKDWCDVLAVQAEAVPRYLSYLVQGRTSQKLVADVSPSYALLPVARLRQMAGLMPNTRFVYLMRDPVARLWSHVRMVAKRAAATANAVPDTCFAMLEDVLNGAQSGMTERGDYIGALTRLGQAVDPSKLMVMFMEDMLTPAGLARLCKFLGITYVEAAFDRPVHVGPALAMTPEHKARACAYLRPQYEFVARHYPDLPANWRKNMGEGL